jgi:hypothetical protein
VRSAPRGIPPERFTVRLDDALAEWIADEAEERDASRAWVSGRPSTLLAAPTACIPTAVRTAPPTVLTTSTTVWRPLGATLL